MAEKKEELAQEKEELNALRKQVAGFKVEQEKAIRAACTALDYRRQRPDYSV